MLIVTLISRHGQLTWDQALQASQKPRPLRGIMPAVMQNAATAKQYMPGRNRAHALSTIVWVMEITMAAQHCNPEVCAISC
jgi:hypothetical protein